MSRLIAVLIAAFVALAWLPAGAQAPADKGDATKMDKKADRAEKRAERKAKKEAKRAERKAKRDAKKAEKAETK